MNADQVRQDQLAHGRNVEGVAVRRQTLKKPVRPSATHAPEGHENHLKQLETSGSTIRVEKASSGEKVVGKVKASDRYTISLKVPLKENDWEGEYYTRVIFKGDISEYTVISRPPMKAEAH